jgi:hypothetical protein
VAKRRPQGLLTTKSLLGVAAAGRSWCWAGEGLSAYQEGQMPNGPNFCSLSLWAAGDTARSRQDDLIERRPEEQGTQDPEPATEGMQISGAMASGPPPICGGAPQQLSGTLGWTQPSPGAELLLGGRGPLGLPGGPNGPKNGSLWGTQGGEISSRRVERGA